MAINTQPLSYTFFTMIRVISVFWFCSCLHQPNSTAWNPMTVEVFYWSYLAVGQLWRLLAVQRVKGKNLSLFTCCLELSFSSQPCIQFESTPLRHLYSCSGHTATWHCEYKKVMPYPANWCYHGWDGIASPYLIKSKLVSVKVLSQYCQSTNYEIYWDNIPCYLQLISI